jgi:hypothetical protein
MTGFSVLRTGMVTLRTLGRALHATELPAPFVLQVTLPSPTILRKMEDNSSDVFVHFGIEEEQCTCSDVCKNRTRWEIIFC